MQKVFRLRTCEDTVFANRSRPCLLYQIKRCTGPCVGLVSESDYAEDVNSAELFLQGREDEAVDRLEERMHRLRRSRLTSRRRHTGTRSVRSPRCAKPSSLPAVGGVDADIVALAASGGLICVNLVMVRGGIHRGDKSFFPQNAQDQDEQVALEAFLTQHYVDREVPPSIIVNRPVEVQALEELLSQQAGTRVQINANPAGERRVWLRMAEKNAELAIAQRLAAHATQETRLTALQQALGLADNVRRIECFDISHTMGEATVASCVVYDNSTMQTGEYRRYNINGVEPGDDYGAMRQVLDRRYRKIVEGEGKLPDLILIDGGKGQVSTAFEVLGELGLSNLPMIGVAKGEERKAGLEQLIFPDRNEAAAAAAGPPGFAPDPADPGRSASLCHLRSPQPPRQGAQSLDAGRNWRDRRQAQAAAVVALRRSEGGCFRKRGGARAGGRNQPGTRRKNLPAATLTPSCRSTFRISSPGCAS